MALAFMRRLLAVGVGRARAVGCARAGARRGQGEEDVVERRLAAVHVVGVDAAVLERADDLDQPRRLARRGGDEERLAVDLGGAGGDLLERAAAAAAS